MNPLFVAIIVFASVVRAQDSSTTAFPPAISSFTCHGRVPGYYADLESGCRTYHVCDGNSHFTYLCPKRTLFQQRSRICDHSYLVRCEDSPHFYDDDDDEDIFIRRSESTTENDNQTEESIPITELTTNEPTETPTAITTTAATSTAKPELTAIKIKDQAINSFEKFLKFRLKDFRSLFFIPEFDNNSVVAKPEREFILPVEETELMTFRNRKEVSRLSSLCPAYCNPKFFVAGTCHPCIMIK